MLRPSLRCSALAAALFAQRALAQDVPTQWQSQLGVYKPFPVVTAEEQEVYGQFFTDYLASRAGFTQVLHDAEGKTDPKSIRLQNFAYMLELVAEIQDPQIQIEALQEFTRRAVAYDHDKKPPKDSEVEKMRHWVWPLEKIIGEGRGICADQVVAEIAAVELLPHRQIQAYYGGGIYIDSHAYTLFMIDQKPEIIVSDLDRKQPETAAKYFAHKNSLVSTGALPLYIMKSDGVVIAVFDEKNRADLPTESLNLTPLPADNVLLEQVKQVGHASDSRHPFAARPRMAAQPPNP